MKKKKRWNIQRETSVSNVSLTLASYFKLPFALANNGCHLIAGRQLGAMQVLAPPSSAGNSTVLTAIFLQQSFLLKLNMIICMLLNSQFSVSGISDMIIFIFLLTVIWKVVWIPNFHHQSLFGWRFKVCFCAVFVQVIISLWTFHFADFTVGKTKTEIDQKTHKCTRFLWFNQWELCPHRQSFYLLRIAKDYRHSHSLTVSAMLSLKVGNPLDHKTLDRK